MTAAGGSAGGWAHQMEPRPALCATLRLRASKSTFRWEWQHWRWRRAQAGGDTQLWAPQGMCTHGDVGQAKGGRSRAGARRVGAWVHGHVHACRRHVPPGLPLCTTSLPNQPCDAAPALPCPALLCSVRCCAWRHSTTHPARRPCLRAERGALTLWPGAVCQLCSHCGSFLRRHTRLPCKPGHCSGCQVDHRACRRHHSKPLLHSHAGEAGPASHAVLGCVPRCAGHELGGGAVRCSPCRPMSHCSTPRWPPPPSTERQLAAAASTFACPSAAARLAPRCATAGTPELCGSSLQCRPPGHRHPALPRRARRRPARRRRALCRAPLRRRHGRHHRGPHPTLFPREQRLGEHACAAAQLSQLP